MEATWEHILSPTYPWVPSTIFPPRAILSFSTLVLEASKQSLVAQTTLLLPEASKGSSKTGDQGQGAEGAKDKGKGKGTKPPSEAKDAAKAKEAEAKAKDASTTQSSQKEAPPSSKAKA